MTEMMNHAILYLHQSFFKATIQENLHSFIVYSGLYTRLSVPEGHRSVGNWKYLCYKCIVEAKVTDTQKQGTEAALA